MKYLKYIVCFYLAVCFLNCQAETSAGALNKCVSIEVVCNPNARMGENFQVNYKMKYSNLCADDYDFKLEISKEENNRALLINFSCTNQSSQYRVVDGKPVVNYERTWTATFKPLKKGNFKTPACSVIAIPSRPGNKSFETDIKSETKKIQIVAADKKIKKQDNKKKKDDVKKIEKIEPALLKIDVPEGDFIVGQPVRVKVFVLLKNLETPYQVDNILLDKNIKIKNAEFRFLSVNSSSMQRFIYEGEMYEGALVDILEITPLKPGKLTIPKIKLEGTGHLFENNAFWGIIPGVQFKYKCNSSPVKINVLEKKPTSSGNRDNYWI